MSCQYSVLIPWADRQELAVTLAANRDFLERHDAETVVVNVGGDYDALQTLIDAAGVAKVTSVDLPGAVFNRSLCLNAGLLASRGDYLFLVDVDIVLRTDVFAEALDDLSSGHRFVAIARIFESSPPLPDASEPDPYYLSELVETRELITSDGRRAVLRSRRSAAGLRAGDGIVLVTRTHMEAVGGLNATMTGWGYEDTDFQLRLQFMLGLERAEAGAVTHLTHPGAGRDMAAWKRNKEEAFRRYARGELRGSLEEDRVRWRDAIGPVGARGAAVTAAAMAAAPSAAGARDGL